LLGFERWVERYRKEDPYERSVYGMDVHKKTISIALMNGDGRLLMRGNGAANIVSEVIRKYKMARGAWTIGPQ
jgi:hypothetical protein